MACLFCVARSNLIGAKPVSNIGPGGWHFEVGGSNSRSLLTKKTFLTLSNGKTPDLMR
ncbi:hypothetical protein TSMEX_004138 [Taenia solium]|eukprot:TsM_000356500 transcript=TsM_000356500 gene=TsM_000356500